MRNDLVYPKFSYEIVGILFSVHNQLGGGLQEKIYYMALKKVFDQARIKYKEQFRVDLNYGSSKITHYFLDFLIDDKIVLEIKTGDRFRKENIEQVYAYLKSTGLQLGILANFTKSSLKYKRILNLY
ncbi:GxxExxY protein [bacterium (Candidatus Howlettbacteria) CG_4_10_14_0_8_um_filter_40_9]|nr:MAG: GxxExxY protein [bacterium (Candidatus Howlettbacteria) CG_4_10_14_0_8_um_filter_40_9]